MLSVAGSPAPPRRPSRRRKTMLKHHDPDAHLFHRARLVKLGICAKETVMFKIVYLDQLHWIEIAKSVTGKTAKPGTAKAFNHMMNLSQDGAVIFPLSISHYYETLKQSDPERRQRLAEVMRQLSRGYTIAALANVVRHEIRSALINLFQLNIEVEKFSFIGKGFEHAFGKKLNLNLVWSKPETVPPLIKDKIESNILGMVEDILLNGVISNSEDNIEWLFPKINLAPDNAFKEHLEKWKGCAANMSATELRRKIYSITLKDTLDQICEQLIELGIPVSELTSLGEDGICKLLDMMPTRKVDMHLRDQWAKNGNLIPKQTDLNDWCYVGAAICYCDLVITENQMNDLLSRSYIYSKKTTANLSDILIWKFPQAT
jgi:hypothetical protein